MTTLDDPDWQKILEYLKMFKRGKRFYNLSNGKKKEVAQLIEKLKDGKPK